MSSQFYSVTMGFMILAAVPVLAIKYHNSNGNVNKVQVKNKPEIASASKADNQPDNSSKSGPDPMAQMNNRLVQGATRSMNTGVARSQHVNTQPVISQQRTTSQAAQNPAARSLNSIGNNMGRQTGGGGRPQGSNIMKQGGSNRFSSTSKGR